jgi:hypothetical protein
MEEKQGRNCGRYKYGMIVEILIVSRPAKMGINRAGSSPQCSLLFYVTWKIPV